MMNKKKVITAIIVLILIGIAWGGVLFNKSKSNVLSVKTAIVHKEDIQSYLNTTGVVKAKNTKDYYGTQLKVTGVNVKVGDKVRKGDVLITFDNSDVQNAAKQAKIQYDNAILQKQDLINQNNKINETIKNLDGRISEVKSKINQLTISTSSSNSSNSQLMDAINSLRDKLSGANSDSTKQVISLLDGIEMAQTGGSSTQVLQQLAEQLVALETQRNSIQPISDEKIKQMDNTVSLAKIAVDSANEKLSIMPSKLVADFDGTVTDLNANMGSVSNPTSPILILEDLDNLNVVVSLAKSDIDKVKIEQTATIKNNGKEYDGKVSFISPSGKKGMASIASMASTPSADVTMDAEIALTKSDEDLKAEFDVDVDILLAEKQSVLVVPTEAIKSVKGGKYVVYIVDKNNKVSEREVKVGIQSEINAEIIDGVSQGDRIILNPSTMVSDGVTVKPIGHGGA